MATSNADESKSATNIRNPKVTEGIIQSLQNVWNKKELLDFEVSVEGEIFHCHSLILASCSEFFRGLLRSNMKEVKEMKVDLNNISPLTFQLVLNSLYSGCDFLTEDNVLGVWAGVHQLQIQFLIEHCEGFVVNNLSLDTVEMYMEHATYLQSENVKEYIFKFMLNNFDNLRQKDMFANLDFDYLMRLVESDELKVSSEDLVLYSILDWVKFENVRTNETYTIKSCNANDDILVNTIPALDSTQGLREPERENSNSNVNLNSVTDTCRADSTNRRESNERKHLLLPLLKAARHYLASEACIEKLSRDNLIQRDVSVKEILFEACTFKFGNYWHGHWPTAAIHRDCGDLKHFGVYCYKGEISALSLKREKWFVVPKTKTLQHSHLAVFKGKLYACTIGSVDNEIYVLNSNRWEQVNCLNHTVQLVVTHEQSIYELDSIENVFIKFNPDTTTVEIETIGHELQNPEFALSFHNNILVFCSVDSNGLEGTAVHSWNTENNKWTQLDTLEFSSKNMTSFRDDVNTYILDSNGNLFKLINTEDIGFKFVTKLWDVKYNAKGAVLFRKTLFIYGESPEGINPRQEVEGVFSTVIIWGFNLKISNFLHYVLNEGDLKPSEQ